MPSTPVFACPAGPGRRRLGVRALLGLGVVSAWLLCSACLAFAQNEEGEEEEGPPPAEDIVLETADGVTLTATFLPGTKGKATVPVVLLHMFKGNRSDYAGLAELLQKEGHAVLVPDLRGHGGSTSQRGRAGPLRPTNLSRNDFAAMVGFDMEAIRQFLVAKNNAGELNIERLCLVGAEMGASVALRWTRLDWNRPPIGHRKQGQDVKAVAAISPERNTPGLPLHSAMTGRNLTTLVFDPQLKKALKNPDQYNFRLPVELDFRRHVSMLIVAGKRDTTSARDAKRLHTMLKPFHPAPPENQREQQDLFYGLLDTSLKGTKMLGVKGLNLERHIIGFIDLRAVRRDFSWAERKNPYTG